jgi:hypothetical protein
MAKIFAGPRQIIYSYLKFQELIKVASLSKRERDIVLTSKIVKENKTSGYYRAGYLNLSSGPQFFNRPSFKKVV